MIGDTTSASQYYQSRFARTPERVGVWRMIFEYLQDFIPPTACVLDLGAGYCSFINTVHAAEKHALDIFPSFIQFANPEVHTHIGRCDDLSLFAVASSTASQADVDRESGGNLGHEAEVL